MGSAAGPAHVHPQWAGLDFEALGASLQEALGSSRVRLGHAWGNLVFSDGDYAYKLTPEEGFGRASRSVALAIALRGHCPGFPTVFPAADAVRRLDFGLLGTWCLSVWPWLDLRSGESRGLCEEDFEALGRALRAVHEVPLAAFPAGTPPHDPLQWARVRVNAVRSPSVRASLSREAELLADAYAEVFPPDLFSCVHGDVHQGQVAFTRANRLLLLDFEHAAPGPPLVDLFPSAGYRRRSGVPSRAECSALLRGYGAPVLRPSSREVAVLEAVAVFSRHTWDAVRAQGDPSLHS